MRLIRPSALFEQKYTNIERKEEEDNRIKLLKTQKFMGSETAKWEGSKTQPQGNFARYKML